MALSKKNRRTRWPIWLVLCIFGVPLIGATQPIDAEGKGNNGGTGTDEFASFENEFGQEEELYDPLMPYNRFMFRVNDGLYEFVLKPVARFYGNVPKEMRRGVSRCFKNVAFPVYAVNNLLQGRGKDAGVNTARFLMNTTLGLGGFFDPADTSLGLGSERNDFGRTLGVYGVGSGAPLVLPLLGMSNLRDTAGRVPDAMLNPTRYLASNVRFALRGLKQINAVSLNWQFYDQLKREALDEYIYLRDLYHQNRQEKIRE